MEAGGDVRMLFEHVFHKVKLDSGDRSPDVETAVHFVGLPKFHGFMERPVFPAWFVSSPRDRADL